MEEEKEEEEEYVVEQQEPPTISSYAPSATTTRYDDSKQRYWPSNTEQQWTIMNVPQADLWERGTIIQTEDAKHKYIVEQSIRLEADVTGPNCSAVLVEPKALTPEEQAQHAEKIEKIETTIRKVIKKVKRNSKDNELIELVDELAGKWWESGERDQATLAEMKDRLEFMIFILGNSIGSDEPWEKQAQKLINKCKTEADKQVDLEIKMGKKLAVVTSDNSCIWAKFAIWTCDPVSTKEDTLGYNMYPYGKLVRGGRTGLLDSRFTFKRYIAAPSPTRKKEKTGKTEKMLVGAQPKICIAETLLCMIPLCCGATWTINLKDVKSRKLVLTRNQREQTLEMAPVLNPVVGVCLAFGLDRLSNPLESGELEKAIELGFKYG